MAASVTTAMACRVVAQQLLQTSPRQRDAVERVLIDVAPDRSIPALDSDGTHNAVPCPLLFDDVLEPR